MFKENNLLKKNDTAALITVVDWVKLSLIGFISIIPIIGWIAMIGIYIYLAVSKDTAKSIKNYLIASLIMGLIAFAIFMFVMIFIISASTSYALFH